MSSSAPSVAGNVFLSSLIASVGADIVLHGDAIPERNKQDWSGLSPVAPLAVALPRTTEDVAAVLKHCHAAHVPVVPQGGLTGLAGGAQPVPGCVALSLERMQGVEEIDVGMSAMTILSGTPLAVAQAAADDAGFLLALDLGARGSCSVGGNLATNAGGNRVIRYGMARDHVLGVEAVLPDGTIIRALNKLIKNNAGFDLKHLFIGSEGTLGVITRAVLKLQPRPSYSASALCAAPDFAGIAELLKAARAELGPSIAAFEVMWPSFYDFMSGKLNLKRPLAGSHGVYVLIENSGFDATGDAERFQNMLHRLMEAGHVSDAVIASSEREAAELWAVREGVSEYGRLLGPVIAFDVGLPLALSGSFVEEMETAIRSRWPDAIALSYGHIGDSNLHLVVHVPSAGADQPRSDVTALVYGAIRAAGGTVSAEHGIGLTKKPYLGYSRTPEEIDLMKQIKLAIDPRNILNPGKVISVAPQG